MLPPAATIGRNRPNFVEDRTLTTRAIIVRHGQSTYNIEQRIQGRLDKSVLTDLGRTTARQVAVALGGINLDAVYCSPLQRAKETAELIVADFHANPPFQGGQGGWQSTPTPQVSENLREIDLPLWEGMLREEVKQKYSEEYRIWKQRPHELCMTVTGENGARDHFPVLALYEQARLFWRETLAQHRGKTILIVAHNGINRCLLGAAVGIPASCYHSIQQTNCGISVLNFPDSSHGELPPPEAVQMESMNLTGHVGQNLPKPRPGHDGPRLLLVRHGETDWNRNQQFQGQIDVPLNDHGRKQAEQAAEFLKDVQIDWAVTSPLARPKETGEIILQYHPHIQLQLDDRMKEISHGLWEGKFEREIEQEFPGMLQQWKEKPETVQMPEGENLQQVWERSIEAWRSIVAAAAPGTTGLVVGHDAINKAILCHLFDLAPEHFWNFKQGNGSVTVIDYPKGADGEPVLQSLNITTHLGGVLDKTAAGAL